MRAKSIIVIAIFLLTTVTVFSQKRPGYTYVAQKANIPVELGAVYLGMPLADLAAKIDLKQAEADARYGPVVITVPFAKGDVVALELKVFGISDADKEKCLTPVTVTRKSDTGDYQEETNRILPAKATKGAFVYEIGITYKPGFDLAAFALKKYGPTKDVYKTGDQFHIYDLQWTKKTTDRLTWIIRYHRSTNYLQLIGVIDGTEWDPRA